MAGKSQAIDMTGEKFGLLTVVGRNGTYPNGQAKWLCQCQCGEQRDVSGSILRRGKQTACGCQKGGVVTHGRTDSPMFNVWQSMIARCSNPRNTRYHRYGGRGIKVCERWQKFENFLEDMGERPDGMTIERKENDGNYEPSNCKWATRNEQAKNTSRNRFIETSRGRMVVADAARLAGVTPGTISYRLKHGVAGESLFAPPHPKRLLSTI